tara:strand:+ start:1294 stop:4371 length:3078 start_codon:yes stop_codon:yes gene_type:complete
MTILHEVLAHLNQQQIRYMIRNELLSSNSSTLFDLSGAIECEACRLFKSQASPKTHHPSSVKKSDSLDGPLSAIPLDLLSTLSQAHAPLDRVHVDGFEFHVASKKFYFYVFTDEYTDYKMVYFVSSKTESNFLTTLQTYHAYSFMYHKTNIKCLKMDNGSEMSGETVYEFARFNGIHFQRCAPYEHHQNGKAERDVRTLEECSLTLLHHAHLSISMFIVYAFPNATQIRNKCLSARTKERGCTPHELFTGVKPRIEDIHPIGQVCYSYIRKEQRRFKYDPKARKCIYLCEDYERKAYLVMDVASRAVLSTRDVRFPKLGATVIAPSLTSPLSDGDNGDKVVERTSNGESPLGGETLATGNPGGSRTSSNDTQNNMPQAPSTPPLIIHDDDWNKLYHDDPGISIDFNLDDPIDSSVNEVPVSDSPDVIIDGNAINDDVTICGEDPSSQVLDGNITLVETSEPTEIAPQPQMCDESSTPPESENLSRPAHVRKPNSRYFNSDFATYSVTTEYVTPNTYKQALNSPQKVLWEKAMDQELESLEREATWTVVSRKPGMFVVRSKWVYKIKSDESGEITRFKARVVALGFTQTSGIDFGETYSPVLNSSTRRLIFCLAATQGMITYQADVETAFLQSYLDRLIYLQPPPGMDLPTGTVLRLMKAIYGLRQSPLLWYLTAMSFFESIGFTKCTSDVCLLYFENSLGSIIVSVYVDDLTLSSTSQALIDWVLLLTRKRFPVRDVKPLVFTVGIHVKSESGFIRVSQKAYIEKMVNRFLQNTERKRKIPMATNFNLHDEESPLMSKPNGVKSYQQIIGSLNYLAHSTRPDILYAVNTLSRFLQNPRENHYEAAQHVVEYLNSSSELSITFRSVPGCINRLHAYCDASLTSINTPDGRSTSGCLVFYNNNMVYWKSARQTVVSLSTMESELEAITLAVHQLKHLQHILHELHRTVHETVIYSDSLIAIKYLLSESLMLKPRTRHLALRYHFVRKELQEGKVKIVHVPGQEQLADILTKPLSFPIFYKLRCELLE